MGTSFSFSFGCHNSIPFDGRITLIMNWKFRRGGGGGVVDFRNQFDRESKFEGIISNEVYFLFKKSGMIVGIQNRYYHM